MVSRYRRARLTASLAIDMAEPSGGEAGSYAVSSIGLMRCAADLSTMRRQAGGPPQ